MLYQELVKRKVKYSDRLNIVHREEMYPHIW